MDQDLQSIASARRCAEKAFKAYQDFLGTDPAHVDAIVDAMARAVEPEAKRLGQMAVEETGYGNVDDKRVKNLFNALSVADFLRDVTTLGMLWRDDAAKVAAFGEPMGVVAALIPVTNPTSTIIYRSTLIGQGWKCYHLRATSARDTLRVGNCVHHGTGSRTNGCTQRVDPMSGSGDHCRHS